MKPILTTLFWLAALLPAGPASTQAAPAPAATPAAVDRVVPLEGGQNFRDLGGYRTADGRTVRRGMIYRSGSMHGLTAADFAELEKRNIRQVFDFRSLDERLREPVAWPSGFTPAIHQTDYRLDMTDLMKALRDPKLTEAQAWAAAERFYAQLPFQFAGQYRAMFAGLLGEKAPLVFNCSAGKDRTGVAAALLLTALGVPRETVLQDYLMSNVAFDPQKSLVTDARADAQVRQLPPAFAKVIMGVDARLLDAAFAAIAARPGGLPSYYEQELGLNPAALAKLRATYLQ